MANFRKWTPSIWSSFALVGLSTSVLAQTWCGKGYMQSQLSNPPILPPESLFSKPSTSSHPLVAFRCAPAIQPYLANERSGLMVIDTEVTHTQLAGSSPFKGDLHAEVFDVSISIAGGRTLATAQVPVNATSFEVPFSFSGVQPQTAPLQISCTAKTLKSREKFETSASVKFLPTDLLESGVVGSVTKMDLRTGALLVQSKNLSGVWEPIFPIGFYTNFDGYLARNLSIIDDLKAKGFNIIHPVPTFENMTAFELVLDRMEQVGIYLMYDMRYSYTNSSSVTSQINSIKSRKNLLLWYTGDEPDGTADPLTAPSESKDLINSLDGGGYHPVSLVLNCQDYYFTEYINGGEVIMQDAYPIGINVSWSVRFNTTVTPTFGDCGCDNCAGSLADIRDRMDVFRERLGVLGLRKGKVVWGVPQAFGGSEYWSRPPTGPEFIVQSVLSINHGAYGIVPWTDPNPEDVKASASQLAQSLPAITTYLADPHAKSTSIIQGNVDVAIWTQLGAKTTHLILATNLDNQTASAEFTLPFSKAGNVKGVNTILDAGARLSLAGQNNGVVKVQIHMDPLGSTGQEIVMV